MIRSKDITIQSSESILDALDLLSQTKKKHLICLDEKENVVGLLTDGDVRRGITRFKSVEFTVADAMNQEPIVLSDQAAKSEVDALLSSRFRLIPVVDAHGKYVGYHIHGKTKYRSSIKDRSIAIVGLGYVGLTLAVTLADCGFRVYGIDVNADLIDNLEQGQAPFFEKGLDRYLKLHVGKNLKLTTSAADIAADIFIICVGTPVKGENKEPDLTALKASTAMVGGLLEHNDLVVIRSTVPISCTREVILPVLEETSGLKCGSDFSLAMAPERTAEGVALQELRDNPQIIGGFDQYSYDFTASVFNSMTDSIIDVSSLEAAELAKLMDNTFRDHLFAYSNNVAQLAEKLGVNIHQVIEAVNLKYHRNMIPKPSPGVGGPCLSKDPYILKSIMERHGLDTPLISCTREINESGPKLMVDRLDQLLRQGGKSLETAKKISLVGMAFKGEPETSDLRDSTSVWFLDRLPKKQNVCAYDPVVSDDEISTLGIRSVSLEDAFDQADAVVILNNHRSYYTWDLSSLLPTMNTPAVVLDTWGHFRPLYFRRHPNIIYGGLGIG